jgi:hypothetical protein
MPDRGRYLFTMPDATSSPKPKRFRTPSFDKFEKDFEPIEHAVTETGNPILLETCGSEHGQVLAADPKTVWTVLDCDGKLRVCAGYHHVDRLNYILTRKPWITEQEVFCY